MERTCSQLMYTIAFPFVSHWFGEFVSSLVVMEVQISWICRFGMQSKTFSQDKYNAKLPKKFKDMQLGMHAHGFIFYNKHVIQEFWDLFRYPVKQGKIYKCFELEITRRRNKPMRLPTVNNIKDGEKRSVLFV